MTRQGHRDFASLLSGQQRLVEPSRAPGTSFTLQLMRLGRGPGSAVSILQVLVKAGRGFARIVKAPTKAHEVW